jgi:hypothetical protein
MAHSREETLSPSWQTETEGSGDDDMDFEVRRPEAAASHAVQQHHHMVDATSSRTGD